jgi:hydrogenase nickel incorporation protein HypB
VERKTLALERKVLAENDAHAAANRAWLAERGVTAINFISSPGSGKTLLLERTLERLRGRVPCAVITGDQRTDNDAKRLMGKGAEVRQIETVNACHLDAARVGALLPEVAGGGVKLLFIENIGNLVCPAAFDLGENFKVALLSTTEGEDKPVKYPTLFSLAPVVVLTKMDLAPHLDWSLPRCREYLRQIRPGVYVFELSARTGQGMDAWIEYLAHLTAGKGTP